MSAIADNIEFRLVMNWVVEKWLRVGNLNQYCRAVKYLD
ncbi:hypothetical protein GARC_4655 [Paraglaciecola arctica BSs20135]|uniref:Uncharacterized protein n=1 Tax=Paraglaciecola arctica BSs20135 TaxID=493475 RepID=K6YTU8_9ALTE|nr:hypothetical protein GARC_4655 [Paraglaciecola arctica BSs20135]